MSRSPMSRAALALLAASMLCVVAGAPNHTGALAGLRSLDAAGLLGLVWLGLFPTATILVPPLLLTGVAEALQTRRRNLRSGLGSRSRPGDT